MSVFKLIESNGLNLHGDIEHFAELVRQDEREACVDLLLRLHERSGGAHNYYQFAAEQIRTRGETK